MRDVNSLNRVILVGHLKDKPIIRYLAQTERPVARFDLATNELVYDPAKNQSTRRAEWHRVVAGGKLAEFCGKYLNKGRQILVEGKIRSYTWMARNGAKRRITEIEAQNIVLLGRREEEPEAVEIEPEATPVDLAEMPEESFPSETETDEEVPF